MEKIKRINLKGKISIDINDCRLFFYLNYTISDIRKFIRRILAQHRNGVRFTCEVYNREYELIIVIEVGPKFDPLEFTFGNKADRINGDAIDACIDNPNDVLPCRLVEGISDTPHPISQVYLAILNGLSYEIG